MQIEVIKTPEEMALRAEEWNTLLNFSASHVPFLRHEYLTTWWKHMGGDEWDSGELHIVIARQEDGNLAGIAPLFFTHNLDDEPALMFLGSIEISDYLDVIARPEDLEPFTQAMFEHLGGTDAPGWEILDLYNISHESPTLPALASAAETLGWRFEQEKIQPCPHIPLSDDWDAYLASMNKKYRRDLTRKMRRMENHFIPASWRIVENGDSLDSELDTFFAMMVQDAQKRAFLTDAMETQMRAIVHTASQGGWLLFAFLEVGGKPAASQLNFDYENRIYSYNSAIAMDFYDLSPGQVLLGHLLNWSIDQGRDEFDFMRGDEGYKYRFGAVDRFVMRAAVRR
jgi:CelD/BcsL family acetyltransferase involved in cellulose biosynthesis